jgi:hypothetical protein
LDPASEPHSLDSIYNTHFSSYPVRLWFPF